MLKMQEKIIPNKTGSIKDAIVHLMLPVSFCTVKRVVEQGQCIRVKIMKHTAVTHVQPFWERMEYSAL